MPFSLLFHLDFVTSEEAVIDPGHQLAQLHIPHWIETLFPAQHPDSSSSANDCQVSTAAMHRREMM